MPYADRHLHSKHLYPLFSQFSNKFLKIPGLPSCSWRIITEKSDITEKFEIIKTHFLASQAHLLLFCYRTHRETVPCSPYIPLLAAWPLHLKTIQGLIEEFSLLLLRIWFHLSKVSQTFTLSSDSSQFTNVFSLYQLLCRLCLHSMSSRLPPKSFLNLPSPFSHLLAPLPF